MLTKKFRAYLIAVLFLLTGKLCFSQDAISLNGVVYDDLLRTPISNATISLSPLHRQAITDKAGRFTINVVKPGSYKLLVSHVGYSVKEIEITVPANKIEIYLSSSILKQDEVVISASRKLEKITEAPAAIQVISREDLHQHAGSNIYELFAGRAGIEFTRYGIDGITLNARGFNSAFNNKVMQVVDNRNTMSPLSGSLPMYNNGTTVKEDIERIEIVLGPQTALFGPNAHNAVVNTITKDPWKYPGTDMALSAGNMSQFSGRFRHAEVINKSFAFKVTGEYATAKDYTFYDSIYAGGNPYGPPVAIPERNVDFDILHKRGEAHIFYRPGAKMNFSLSGGASLNNWLQVQTGGRNQMRATTYEFLQAKISSPHFFGTIYHTWGGLGKSYNIANYTRDYWNRTHSTILSGPMFPAIGRLSPDSAELFALRPGTTFRENSRRLNADVQYNTTVNPLKLKIITGLFFQQDNPNGYGINLIDKDKKISINQVGGLVELDKSFENNLRLVFAVREDYHSIFKYFLSPKLSLVKGIGEGSIRVNWGRAYAMPSILNQFAGINNFLFGNGSGITYIPNGKKLSDLNARITTSPLKPELVETLELGYRGHITSRFFMDINTYYGKNTNFISPTRTVGGRAVLVGDVPVVQNSFFAGRVSNDTLYNASFFTYFNYGTVHHYGLDVSLNYMFTERIVSNLNYSYFNSDITGHKVDNDANKDGFISSEERSLNAPNHRAALSVKFMSNGKHKTFSILSIRYVQQYDFYSASQVGTAAGAGSRGKVATAPGQPPLLKNFDHGALGGFTTLNFSAGLQLNTHLDLGLSVQNILNTKQLEFVGSPSIGRIIAGEIHLHLDPKP